MYTIACHTQLCELGFQWTIRKNNAIGTCVDENGGISNNTEVFDKCSCLHMGKYQCQLMAYINGKIFFPLSFPKEDFKL